MPRETAINMKTTKPKSAPDAPGQPAISALGAVPGSSWPVVHGLKVLQRGGNDRQELKAAIVKLAELEQDRKMLNWLLARLGSLHGECVFLSGRLSEVELSRDGIYEAMESEMPIIEAAHFLSHNVEVSRD